MRRFPRSRANMRAREIIADHWPRKPSVGMMRAILVMSGHQGRLWG